MAVVTHILDGLVAAGTLALAGVTAWLAFVSRNAVGEAYRARVDAESHRLVVSGLLIEERPVTKPRVAGAEPFPAEVGTHWDLTQHGQVSLGQVIRASLFNEGRATCLLRLVPPDSVENVTFKIPPGPWDPTPDDHVMPEAEPLRSIELPDGGVWQLLGPGPTAEITFVWWRTAREWASDWQPPSPPPTVSVTVEARDQTESVADGCVLTAGAHVLMPKPTQDGWLIVPHDLRHVIQNPPPGPVTTAALLQRTYPGR